MYPVNPQQLIQMIKSGQNPQQVLFSILQGQANTPIGANLLNLAKEGIWRRRWNMHIRIF